MTHLLKWRELRVLPFGTALVFPDAWDIYPYTIIPAGTKAIMVESEDDIMLILPDNAKVRDSLAEWHGCIQFAPVNDGYGWDAEFPVALADSTAGG